MRLSGKTAVVTGSSQGIGRGIVERFAREGADVVINYNRSPGGAHEVLAGVEATGRRGLIVQADVSTTAGVRHLIDAAVDHFGELDILVNNAGVEVHAPFWEVTEEDYDRVLNVNLKGVFFATQAMVNHARQSQSPGPRHQHQFRPRGVALSQLHRLLRQQGRGENADSQPGRRARPSGHHRQRHRPPAPSKTPINTKLLNDPAKLNALLSQIPLNRLGQPEDVAGVAVFLASDDAAYVTGSTYFVDGGLTWHYEEQ